jgi:hypothetical protein
MISARCRKVGNGDEACYYENEAYFTRENAFVEQAIQNHLLFSSR